MMFKKESGRQFRILNLKKDPEDLRDFAYRSQIKEHRTMRAFLNTLPNTIDHTSEMSPVKDQGFLGCHDEQTEVLTNEGWKKFKILSKKELLGTVNPSTKKIEFRISFDALL